MTGDAKKFIRISYKASHHVTYGDKNIGKILGVGKVTSSSSIVSKNVLLVEELKHNLLSISQLCGKGLKVIFETNHYLICCASSNEIVLVGKRIQNIYTVDFENTDLIPFFACLLKRMIHGFGIKGWHIFTWHI